MFMLTFSTAYTILVTYTRKIMHENWICSSAQTGLPLKLHKQGMYQNGSTFLSYSLSHSIESYKCVCVRELTVDTVCNKNRFPRVWFIALLAITTVLPKRIGSIFSFLIFVTCFTTAAVSHCMHSLAHTHTHFVKCVLLSGSILTMAKVKRNKIEW